MNAKQCDICGGYFTPYRQANRFDTIVMFNSLYTTKFSHSRDKWDTFYELTGAYKYDLCDKCVSQLKEILFKSIGKGFNPNGRRSENPLSVNSDPNLDDTYAEEKNEVEY